MDEQSDARFTIRTLLLAVLATIILTVLALEMSGRIDHGAGQGNAPIGEFKAIHIKPGEDYRMSPKSSELHAACQNGFLAIASDSDPSFFGILVDYKNRGVRCRPMVRPQGDQPSAAPKLDQAAPADPD
ncbi:kinase [Marinobacter sp.]|uniref:kinase n=1 Tax=Marinobacter sp. TaxID=50741 RepID=UPI00384AC98C